MSQAVLISIRPKWCSKIANGEKTIEVRKTRPKMDMPFKCYIYRSVQGGVIGEFICDDIFERIVRVGAMCEPPKYCICDWNMDCTPLDTLLADACLTKDELEKYLDGGVGYGWHISDLKIYDTPKEIHEFWAYNKELHKRYDAGVDFCCYDATDEYGDALTDCGDACNDILNCYRCWGEWNGWCHRLKHPPQNWCYVEELP